VTSCGFTVVCGGIRDSSISKGGVTLPNKDQIEGTVKEKVGDLTDDESTEAEGKAQGAWGDLKDEADDLKDDLDKRF
jgi:uncharacterized protein YjbJ (UPF0337 family)